MTQNGVDLPFLFFELGRMSAAMQFQNDQVRRELMTRMHLSLESVSGGENVATDLIGTTLAKEGDDCPELDDDNDDIFEDSRGSIANMRIEAHGK